MSPSCRKSCSNGRCKHKAGGKSRTPMGHLRSNVMTVLRRWFPQNEGTDCFAAPSQFNCYIETLLYKFSRLGVYEGLARDYKLRSIKTEDIDVKAILASLKLKACELQRMGSCTCASVRFAEAVYRTKNRMLCASRALRRSLISMIDQDCQPTEAIRFKICSIFSLLDEIEENLNFMVITECDAGTSKSGTDLCMPAGDCLPVCPDALRREVPVEEEKKCEMDDIALEMCGPLKLPTMGPSMARIMKRRVPIIQCPPCELAGLDITYTKMKRTIYETRKCDKSEITEENVVENQVSFAIQPENPDQPMSTSNIRLMYRTAEAEVPRNLKNESNQEKLALLSNVWLSTARHLVDVYFTEKGPDGCPPCRND